MILILGGTTEGRAAVRVADEGAIPYYYSTKGTLQEVDCAHGIRLSGAMDAEAMDTFCRDKNIKLLIDAAHPFASALHATIARVSASLQIPVVRYERRYPLRDKNLIWCADYAEAIQKLKNDGIRRLLALTGVNTLAPLRAYWESTPCWFRILDRDESATIAGKQGFPTDRLVFFQEGGDERKLLEQLRPDAILTKESGYSGYFREKVEAANHFKIPVYVIQRPALPRTFYTIYGEDGLRKRIERLVPEFFPLRSGYTTGACATAAAKAALFALLTGHEQTESLITLPSGEAITLPITTTEWTEDSAICTVVKDSGDDPDVTNGCSVCAEVAFSEEAGIHFKAGEGVGTVTLPGLGLEVGDPAINTTPRQMMTEELTDILNHSLIPVTGLIVTLSVPGGEKLAARTFNPKLGIVGGISIIGTSGIVRPFSTDAFIASIRKEASVAKAIGCQTLVINSGAKSERFLRAQYKEFLPQAFVHYGNFIGETLRIAASLGFPHVVLGIMIGKAVKLAEGSLDTHSKKVVMNKEFLKKLAVECGCSPASTDKIDTITLARELWQLFPIAEQSAFFHTLLQKCKTHCLPLLPESQLDILLISEEGNILYKK